MKVSFFFVSLLFIFIACDKIEPPFKQQNNITNDTNVFIQKVLIEDFTGHRCGNCPRAHEKLRDLKNVYGSKIVAISIHSGFFAMPLPPSYPADYRTPEGDEITNTFGITQYPSGMVNRKIYNGNLIMSHDSWAEAANAILQQQPSIGMSIQNSFQQSNNTITSIVTLTLLQELSVPMKLCIFLTEDSIISPQTDYSLNPNLIPNYVHMHMLRKSFNGAWGTEINLTNKNIGDTIKRSFSLPWNNNWKKQHAHVIAFVYNTDNNEVIQVEEKSVE